MNFFGEFNFARALFFLGVSGTVWFFVVGSLMLACRRQEIDYQQK
jgi:thiosulfate reductase cytochrome b subunit